MISDSLGFIDSKDFSEALLKVCRGMEVPTVTVMRTLGVEFWLRNLRDHEILTAVLPINSMVLSKRPELTAHSHKKSSAS